MISLQGSAVRLPNELSIPRWERAVRTVAGAGFACAAVGNAVAFLPRAGEQLAWFRDTAWLPPYPRVLNRLIEIAPLTVGSAVVYESAVAALLLTRRHETAALGLATVWVVGLIPAVGWPYWLANVPLGLGLGALWWRSPAGRRRQLDAFE
jgi:hypothetical protein